jgi:hypothetical protein
MAPDWSAWLGRVRHDLVKRLLWPARDRRDMGSKVRPGELVARLVDDEGNPATAQVIWAKLREDAPSAEHPALHAFQAALETAVAAAARDDVEAVLTLEPAFDRLAQGLAGKQG